MLAVTLPTGERRGRPEMGRRAAHWESALQAAVLLAVLALSIAAPRTAVRNRLEEAGGATGRTIADWTTWTDVPKEALTIFDNTRTHARTYARTLGHAHDTHAHALSHDTTSSIGEPP